MFPTYILKSNLISYEHNYFNFKDSIWISLSKIEKNNSLTIQAKDKIS